MRLLFLVVEEEAGRGGPMPWTNHLREGFHIRLADEKAPEDLHGHGRDLSRSKRNKRVSLAALYASAQMSGVIEGRKHPGVSLRPQDIACQSWKHFHQQARLESPFASVPKECPAFLRQILDPATELDNPTMMSQAKATVAWQWLLFQVCQWGRRVVCDQLLVE